MIHIQTEPCIGCGKISTVSVPEANYLRWQGGALIADAFPPPQFTSNLREMLMTGTHESCWDIVTAESEDDEPEDGPVFEVGSVEQAGFKAVLDAIGMSIDEAAEAAETEMVVVGSDMDEMGVELDEGELASPENKGVWLLKVGATSPLFLGDVEAKDLLMSKVHDRSQCAPNACWMHEPSDHPMRTWPLSIRWEKGTVERTCSHGVGHPDPDDAAFQTRRGWTVLLSHGCDGCCEQAL